NPSSSHRNVNFDPDFFASFRPHDAMLLRADYPTQSNSKQRHAKRRQDSFPQLTSNTTNQESYLRSNLTELFSAADVRSLTAHDDNFDEIKHTCLAEGFDPVEVSHLFEECGSDSGLALNFHSTTSYACHEGAVGHSSDVQSFSSHGLGAVDSHSQEHSKYGHVEYPGDAECSKAATLQFPHNHTYNHLPSQAASTPEHQQMWMEKPNEVKDRCHNFIDTNLSRDECCVKPLRMLFSVDETVSMLINSFMSRHASREPPDRYLGITSMHQRGKNKVAAQSCHKYKLKAILNLEEDVRNLQTQKRLKKEHPQHSRISWMKQKLSNFYHDIFRRDDQGRPVNPRQLVIHCSSNGSVFIIPKHLVKSEQKGNEKKQKQK
ncbi:LOW QUALITY PROTEIN: nuclear factor erythroid 2-related factor 3, partial [Leptosomus discolor]